MTKQQFLMNGKAMFLLDNLQEFCFKKICSSRRETDTINKDPEHQSQTRNRF